MNDELKIKIEFSIKKTDYNDYENVLQNFEHSMHEIGCDDLEITENEKSDTLKDSEKENLMDMINCRISTPFTNCVIVHLSNGWNILKSHNTTIAMRKGQEVIIDLRYYNYSVSTGKHRNYFLNETLKDTDKKIKNGEYQTADLN